MSKGVFVGLATIDLVYTVDQVPSANAKVVAKSQDIIIGGPATNAAITFTHLGGTSTLVAPVGRHAISHLLRDDLRQFSIDLIDLSPAMSDPPAISSIAVDSAGQRSIISLGATRSAISPPSIDPSVLAEARVLMVDGHGMEACQAWAEPAQQAKVPVVFDGGSWKPGTEQLLKSIDVAICSADFLPPGCNTEADAVAYLREHGVRTIAITHGAGPIYFISQSSEHYIDVPRVNVVDTMGAGDILHGAFCYYFCEGASFQDALSRAASIASESCRHHGTRRWMKR